MDIIDVIYLIDGRYAGRNDNPQYQDDMTEAIVHATPKIHYIKMYNVKQIEKRNKYWELAEKDGVDWVIVLDSDEYIEIKNPNSFMDLLNNLKDDYPMARCFPVAGNNLGHFFPMPRLFTTPFDYRHRHNIGNISHGSLYDPQGKEIINDMYQYYNVMRKVKGLDGNMACVPYIELVHTKDMRTEDRVNRDYIYYSDNPDR